MARWLMFRLPPPGHQSLTPRPGLLDRMADIEGTGCNSCASKALTARRMWVGDVTSTNRSTPCLRRMGGTYKACSRVFMDRASWMIRPAGTPREISASARSAASDRVRSGIIQPEVIISGSESKW